MLLKYSLYVRNFICLHVIYILHLALLAYTYIYIYIYIFLVQKVSLNQGRIKGRAGWAAARGANLQGALRHHYNKSEIWIIFNIGLKGRQIISLPRAPTCLGPVLI
jgi:hypothetical protein